MTKPSTSINPRRLRWGFLGAVLLGTLAWGFDLITDSSNIYVVVWNPGTVTMQLKINQVSPPPLSDGSASYNATVQAAIQIWNARLGVVQLNGVANGTSTYDTGNDVNEVVMDGTVDGDAFTAGTLAVTISFRDGNTRAESDIIFNNTVSWDSYRGPRAGHQGKTDIQRVAIHELGHVLGLDHPDEAGQPVGNAIMDSHASDIDTLTTDDIAGGQTLYGAPGVTQPNNNFANAITITLPANNTGSVTGSNIAATKETGEPNHAPDEPGGKSVWWKWTAPGSGSTTVTTLGSNFDTLLGVYTGITVNALTTVGSNDDVSPPTQQSNRVRTSTVTFNAVNGTTYFFAVDGWDGSYGAVTLNITATLSAGAPPTITTQPASASITTGGTASFSVVATGTGTLTYQWSFNGTAVNGATSATFTISNAQAGNAGTYAVVVSNASGSVTSSNATLTVTTPAPAPTPTPPPSSGGGGGGGGAPSLWFYGALSLLGLGRYLRRSVMGQVDVGRALCPTISRNVSGINPDLQ